MFSIARHERHARQERPHRALTLDHDGLEATQFFVVKLTPESEREREREREREIEDER